MSTEQQGSFGRLERVGSCDFMQMLEQMAIRWACADEAPTGRPCMQLVMHWERPRGSKHAGHYGAAGRRVNAGMGLVIC